MKTSEKRSVVQRHMITVTVNEAGDKSENQADDPLWHSLKGAAEEEEDPMVPS